MKTDWKSQVYHRVAKTVICDILRSLTSTFLTNKCLDTVKDALKLLNSLDFGLHFETITIDKEHKNWMD